MKSRFKTVSTAFIVALLTACQHEGDGQPQDPSQEQQAGQVEQDQNGADDLSHLVRIELRLDGMTSIRPPESNIYVKWESGEVVELLDMMSGDHFYRDYAFRVADTCGKPFEVGGYKERTLSTGDTFIEKFSATIEGDCGTTYLCVLPNTFPYYEGCEHIESGNITIDTCPLICEKQ